MVKKCCHARWTCWNAFVGGRTEKIGDGDAEEARANRALASGAEEETGVDPDQHRPGQ